MEGKTVSMRSVQKRSGFHEISGEGKIGSMRSVGIGKMVSMREVGKR